MFFAQQKLTFRTAAVLVLSMVAIFGPDTAPFLTSRSLSVEETDAQRHLQDAPTPPPAMAFSCEAGMDEYRVDWSGVDWKDGIRSQAVEFSPGFKATITISETGGDVALAWGIDGNGDPMCRVESGLLAEDAIPPGEGAADPTFPSHFGTMEIKFDRELEGLYISASDIDSTGGTTEAVRIRMFDGRDTRIKATIDATGTIDTKDDFAYQAIPGKLANNPGYEASLYAKATGAVQTIKLDQSIFIYNTQMNQAGSRTSRTIFPGLDFAYCAPTPAPTQNPTPVPTPKPTNPPDPTKTPTVDTKPPVPAPVTPVPTSKPTNPPDPTKPPTADTKPPVPAPVEATKLPSNNGGVSGDPLIMGLSGQLFKFDGRSGAWYSAVSTPSFQWNLQVNNYETCPNHSDTFVTAAGFTFFDKKGHTSKKIEVNVVNQYNVDVGCGRSEDQSCLGAGSLELVIDGVKHIVGGDYKTKDGTARITAFNTFYQCARKWYDFDIRPSENPTKGTSLRSGRALSDTETDVFDVISGLKSTMIDKEECQKWIKERQAYSDLFKQPGHYSTVIIKTEDITLHVEYKQENERCNAHSVDVWISSVSESLLAEKWEGVIGETKDPNYVPTGEDSLMMDRAVALKYPHDEDYEVNSPFSTRCRGCNHN